MKYKLLGLAAAIAILFVAVAATPADPSSRNGPRVHQHLSARTDTGCGCGGEQLCSHLPLVVIDTGGQRVPGEVTGMADRFGQATYTTAEDGNSMIRAEISVIDNEDRNNHLTDEPDFATACAFRIRGNSSRKFPKLPYLVKFINEEGEDQDIPVMGMDAHHEWVLNGPILDKSLLRNYMWYNISGEIMEYAPNVRFCELVLNGEYLGLYLVVETVTGGDGCRLQLSLDVKDAEATGYLLRVDRPTEADLETTRDIYAFSERSGQINTDVAIRYPGKSKLTPKLAKDIELDYSAFEKSLYSFDHNSDSYGYWNWINVDSFVDYFLINEFTKNADAGSFSTYIYKEAGGKFKLCVWDFNNACDNYQEQEFGAESFFMVKRAWYFMLFKNEEFTGQVLRRYEQLRRTFLSDEYLMGYIDETLAFLGPALERNNQRWAAEIAGWNGLADVERNLHSHEAAVEQLKEWLLKRGAWLDSNMHTLQQYAHPSRNKSFNH